MMGRRWAAMADRGMFMLDFHVYPMENSPSPLHSESCIKHLCVWRERLSCADIPTGSSCAIGRL